MSAKTTFCLRPTLGEVLAYYTRSDFLQFLLATARVRPVAMIVSTARHWAVRWDQDIIGIDDEQALREYVIHRIRSGLPGLGDGDYPDFYPSFHQMVGKWPEFRDLGVPDAKKPPRTREMDCIFESDVPTWQEAFRDVLPVLALMDKHGVRYEHKFSGHRSLHVRLPGGTFPSKYGGKGAKSILQSMHRWYGSRAHYLPQINRMPYSLNEDTGMVCLPIRRGALRRFRPWQALLHLVEIDDLRQNERDEEDRARAQAFLDALARVASQGEQPERKVFAAWDRATILPRYRDRQPSLGSGARRAAWLLLVSDQVMAEEALRVGLACPDIAARWLTVEAFLLHGRTLSETSCAELMSQEDEYVRAAAMDVLLHFEDDLYAHALGLLRDLGNHHAVTLALSSLMARSNSFRQRVLDAFSQGADCPRDALPAAACAVGAMTGDWPGAFTLLEPLRALRAGSGLTDQERPLVRAIELLSTLAGWDREMRWRPKEEAKKQRELAALGPDIVDLMLVAAVSPNELFRNGVVAALSLIGDARAANTLTAYLGYDFSDMRWKAISGLQRIGEPAVDALLVAAASDQPLVRRNALLCLGRIGSPRARPAILEALDDADRKVRRRAYKAMQRVVSKLDVERLARALREEGWENALLAAEAIARTGATGERVLLEMVLGEQNPAAAYALAARGDPRGRDVLVGWLPTDGVQHELAVDFLRELGDERCVPFLGERLERTGGERGRSIALELGRIKGELATAVLLRALASADKLVRRGAAQALGGRQDPAVIGPLIECIAREDDPKVRNLAAGALQGLGEAAKEPLLRALDNGAIPGKHGQNAAKRVLWSMGIRI